MGKVKVKDKKALPEGPSSQFRTFCWAIAFLSLAQLLVGIDYITIWPGGEAKLLAEAVGQLPSSSPAGWLLAYLPLDATYWLLWYRLPGLLLSLGGLYFFARWGQPLFGQQTITLTLLIAAASIFLPSLLKRAALDVWAFGPVLAAYIALLRYYKQATPAWRWASIGSGVIAILLGGLQAVVLLLLCWLLLLSLTKGPRRLEVSQQLRIPALSWAIAAVGISLLSMLGDGLLSWDKQLAYPLFSLGHLSFFGWSLAGLLPVIGFALAGFRDLLYKLGRNEELSLLLVVGLIASFLTKSLLFPFLLAFLAAKQVQAYFSQPNYPWQNWVKGAMVLHLIFVFIGVVLSLLGGYANFEAEGFRAILGCSAAYWMFSFLGVIGLYGERRDYVIGGTILAGVVALLFFWVQVYPFLELQRNWPKRLTRQLEQLDPPVSSLQFTPTDSTAVLLPALPYLRRSGTQVSLQQPNTPTPVALELLHPTDSIQSPYRIQLEGWAGLWESVKVGVK